MDKEKIIEIFYDNADKIIICRDKEFNDVFFPLIVIHETGFYIFFEGNISEVWTKKKALEDIYQLQLFFNTSRLNFYVYGIDKSGTYYLDPYTDDITVLFTDDNIDNLIIHILDILKSGIYTIDENKLYYYKEKISQYLNKDKTTRTDDEGNTLIKKGSNWYYASSEDPDLMFNYTLLGGIFGLHKFKQGKKWSGIGYLLTGGLLGIGWIFDLLALLLGVSKDSDGCYYLPVSDKKKKIIIFLCCIPLSFLVMKLYSFILTFLSTGLAQILTPIISSFM